MHPMKQTVLALVTAAALAVGCSGESEQSLLASARSYIDKGDPKSATLQLKTLLQKNGDHGEARALLGSALLAQGNPVAAAVELRKARELRADDVKVLPPLAKALIAQGEFKKAIDDLGNAELADPRARAELKTTLAKAYTLAGDAPRAQDALKDALQAVPQFAPALVVKARLAAAGGDINGALALVEEVLGREKANEDAWMLKGELLAIGKNDRSGAVSAWRSALAGKPDLLPAHVAIVRTLLQEGDLAGATAQAEAMKRVHPKHPDTQYVEAQIAFLNKDHKSARDHINGVLKVRPNDPLALQMAGLAEFQLQNFTTAENFLARALKAQPGLGLAREALAQIYLRAAQPGKAVELLAPMVAASGADARIVVLAAEAHRQAGDPKRADELYAKAGRSDTKSAKVQAALALNQAAKGDDKAFGELERLAAADTAGTNTDLALIQARLAKRDVEGALKGIDALARKQPDKPLAWHLRGRVLLLKNDEKGAVAAFEKALSLDKAYAPSAASLAGLDLLHRQPDAARKRLDDVLAANPKNMQAQLAVAELRARTGGSKEEVAALLGQAIKDHGDQARPHVMLIAWYLGRGDGKAALSAARDATGALPDNLDVMDALGMAQIAGGDALQAVSTYKRLSSLRPTSPQPLLQLANAYAASKNSDGAANALRRALQLQPDLPAAQRALAALSMANGRPQDAVAIARELQKKRPADALGYLMEGDAEASGKNWDAAISAWKSGLAKARTGELAPRVVHGLYESGKSGEAEKFVAAWMVQHPKDLSFLSQVGDQAIAGKQWARAEGAYRELLKIDPNNVPALNNMAFLLLQQSKPGALGLAQKANTLQPDRPPLMDTLSLALLAEGQGPKALDMQKRAVDLAPDAPDLRLTLARIYVKTGAKDQARTELDKLAKLGDKFSQQAEVGELLKSL